ncbi:ATP-binding protein [Streptomyces sp. MMBL 11-3]|uniref:ATP-binding protein n=1 Tax=Streptomyces sp. MMBL 11-3 TaxID=3382639 RepID=UPI0039B410B3
MTETDTPSMLLEELCHDLRLLWSQAGGPSLRVLGAQVGLGKSQVGAILSGDVRRLPDWDVVRGLLDGFQRYAHAHGRTAEMSLHTGVTQYWRPRYAVVEHAFRQRGRRGRRPGAEADGVGAARVAPKPGAGPRPPSGSPAHESDSPAYASGARARPRRPPAAASVPPAPAELPHAVAGFSGRTAELAALDAFLRPGALLPTEGHAPAAPAAPAVSAVVIAAIGGSAGVGKTALALHWAHRVRGHFPDGQLYVNLRGFDHEHAPVPPQTALGHMLRSLGVAPADIPADLDELTRTYRSRLVDRRLLLVLDNAASADQVRPLLPGSPSCHTLVTSRNRLGGLIARDGAVPLVLDVLDPGEARTLLEALLGRERTAAEPDAASELVRLCGFLPLALRVAAAHLQLGPGRRIADLVAELAVGERLAALELDDDPSCALRSAFALSYQALDDGARQLFRRLSVIPGPDFTVPAAAALLAVAHPRARLLLETLAAAHLVENHRTGRYRFHDLLREYARERAGEEETTAQRTEAFQRLAGWYLRTVRAAAGPWLFPEAPPELGSPAEAPAEPAPDAQTAHTVPTDGPTRPDPTAEGPQATGGGAQATAEGPQALERLAGERANLLAAVDHAARHGSRAISWHLTDAMYRYFWFCLPRSVWWTTARTALDAAAAEGDLRGQAAMHVALGLATWDMARYQDAQDHYARSLELSRRADWPIGQGWAHGGLGLASWSTGHLDEALRHYTVMLRITRTHRDTPAESTVLAAIGKVYRDMGRLAEAADLLELALRMNPRFEWRREPPTLPRQALGVVRWEMGMLREGLEDLEQVLTAEAPAGSRVGHAMTLATIAMIHRDLGHHRTALALGERAHALVEDTGRLSVRATILNGLAGAHHGLGRDRQAARLQRQALLLAQRSGYPRVQADTLLGLAALLRGRHHGAEARSHAGQALDLARHSGFRVVEGQALTELAEIAAAEGEYHAALAHAHDALRIQGRTGHRLGEARALTVCSRALHALDDPAAPHTRDRAMALLTDAGAPVPDDLRTTTADPIDH